MSGGVAGKAGDRLPMQITAVAVVSLALGIGANTAIFTLLDQVLLRLLPVQDPQQLVLLNMKGFFYGGSWDDNTISYPMYLDFRDHNSVFSGMFCRFANVMSLGFGGRTERVQGEFVSGSHFPVLGVGAAAGRTFTAEDDHIPSGHPQVMLSYSYWMARFAGDPSILGKTAMVNGHRMTIVGVAQRGFEGVELGRTAQVFVPLMMMPAITNDPDDKLHNRRARWVNAFGRLKPGISAARAEVVLQPFFHAIREREVQEPAFRNASPEVRAKSLRNVLEVLPGSQGRSFLRELLWTPMWVLLALTGGVLLIACANMASLLVAKAASRQREMAIRLAMGAGRLQLIRQLLLESLLLSVGGGVLGLLLAVALDHLLLTFLPADTTSLNLSANPDPRVLLFTMSIAVLTGIVFGLAPALQGTRTDIAPTLKDQSGGLAGASGGTVRLRKGLVAAQVTLSLLLLVGAGLFVRSLRNLATLGPGFPSENLVAFNLDPSLTGYSSDKSKAFYKTLTEAIGAIPGVRSTGLASVRILSGNNWTQWMTVEGYHPGVNETPEAHMNSIGPGYFSTLEVPVLYGRDFTARDAAVVSHSAKPQETSPAVVTVNEKFARKYFGSGANAVGRHVGFGIDPGTKMDMEIIGVVKDIKYSDLRTESPIQMFEPYLADQFVSEMMVYARTSMDPNQFFSAVRAKVRELDSNLPLYEMRTMDTMISNSLIVERLIASLSTVFGMLATLLAMIGLYGVMAYSVARRTREIGIRMALGALRGNVVWLVMREVLVLVSIGIVVGLAASVALTRLVQTQLYGLTAHDPLTLGAATLGLVVVAGVAGYIPAVRGIRVDAIQALRYE